MADAVISVLVVPSEDGMVFVSVSVALLLDCCWYELEMAISELEVLRMYDEVVSVRVDSVDPDI